MAGTQFRRARNFGGHCLRTTSNIRSKRTGAPCLARHLHCTDVVYTPPHPLQNKSLRTRQEVRMPKISKQERAQDEAEEQHIREEIKACTASFGVRTPRATLAVSTQLPVHHTVASQLRLHCSCVCIAAAVASTLLIADAASLMHQARAHREAGAIASHACITAAGASHCCITTAGASHCCIAAAAASRCCITLLHCCLAYQFFADRSSSLRTSRVCAIACLYHMLAPQLLAAQPHLAHTAAALTPRSACAETRRRTDGDRAAGIGARRNETLGEHANGEVEGQGETGRVRRRQMHQRRMPCVSHRVRE